MSGLKLVRNVGKIKFYHLNMKSELKFDSTMEMKRERRAGIVVLHRAGFPSRVVPIGADNGQWGIIPRTETRDCPS